MKKMKLPLHPQLARPADFPRSPDRVKIFIKSILNMLKRDSQNNFVVLNDLLLFVISRFMPGSPIRPSSKVQASLSSSMFFLALRELMPGV